MSRREVSFALAAAAAIGFGGIMAGAADAAAVMARRVELKPFRNAPFPYHGVNPDTGLSFLDINRDGRRGHMSARGGIYWEDQTYNDSRALLVLPAGFDIGRECVIVVYFHGNDATLERDVIARQAVVDQVEASGLNAALVAPQFAVDALDSSAGRFWLPRAFHNFMDEARARLGALHGGAEAHKAFDAAPVILVAYSGGYDPAAYSLAVGGESRIRGVLLFDAVFGESDKFANWIIEHHRTSFFFSAYSTASEPGNRRIARVLAAHEVEFSQSLPARLVPGVVSLYGTGDDVAHEDYMTDGWEAWPLKSVLGRISGYARRP